MLSLYELWKLNGMFIKTSLLHLGVFLRNLIFALALVSWNFALASGDESSNAQPEPNLSQTEFAKQANSIIAKLEAENPLARKEVQNALAKGMKQATFAGGCFWCMEPPFEKEAGVEAVVSGYMGDANQLPPTYGRVSSGSTSYLEVVQVLYDPKKITYARLLEIFWRNIDPTDPNGQFVDKGKQYTTAIFTHSEEQKTAAEAAKTELQKQKKFSAPIVTVVRPATTFFPAEDHHQNYYKTNKAHYYLYRSGSGRDAFIQRHWQDSKK